MREQSNSSGDSEAFSWNLPVFDGLGPGQGKKMAKSATLNPQSRFATMKKLLGLFHATQNTYLIGNGQSLGAEPMFIVSLTYVVPLDEVDAVIPAHVAFLEKHYADRHISGIGRQGAADRWDHPRQGQQRRGPAGDTWPKIRSTRKNLPITMCRNSCRQERWRAWSALKG